MGARTDPEIVLVAPIDEIVPAFGPGPGVVGDLIGRQPGGRKPVLRRLEQCRRAFFIGQREFAAPSEGRKGGTGLDRQLVERQVLAGKGERLIELAAPDAKALAGAGVDQVEREPRKCRAGMVDRGDGLLSVMGAAQQAQGRRVERLDSERQPVDAGGGKGSKTIGFGGIWVGLEGDFQARVDRPMGAHRVEQGRDGLRQHQRGRAPAEGHRADFASGCEDRLPVEVGEQGPRPAPRIDTVADMAVEIAIRTFRPAERPVDVDSERLAVESAARDTLTRLAALGTLSRIAGEGLQGTRRTV